MGSLVGWRRKAGIPGEKRVEGQGNEGILIVRIMVCAEGTSVQVGRGREGDGGREEGRVDRGKGRE